MSIEKLRLIPIVTTLGLAGWMLGCGSTRMALPTIPETLARPVETSSPADNIIPSGTVLPVRTDSSIRTADTGGVYAGTLSADIISSDYDVIAGEGAPVELTIVRARRSGAVGTPEIELALRSITLRGRTYQVSSEGNAKQGERGLGENQRTARTAGPAAQVLTRGKEVSVPAETVLSFRLSHSLHLAG